MWGVRADSRPLIVDAHIQRVTDAKYRETSFLLPGDCGRIVAIRPVVPVQSPGQADFKHIVVRFQQKHFHRAVPPGVVVNTAGRLALIHALHTGRGKEILHGHSGEQFIALGGQRDSAVFCCMTTDEFQIFKLLLFRYMDIVGLNNNLEAHRREPLTSQH